MRFTAALLLSSVLFAAGAGTAAAAYPPAPAANASASASQVQVGQPVTFTFGQTSPFTPGATVNVSSDCVADGERFAGPATTVVADTAGIATATLHFSRPGQCAVTGNGPTGAMSASVTITVVGATAAPAPAPAGQSAAAVTAAGPAGGTASPGGNSLATTGGNVLPVAAAGGVAVAAGVGLVWLSRRRHSTS